MKRRYWVCLILLLLWAANNVRSWYESEIALEMGGTYESMRKQSSARMESPYPDGGGPMQPKSNARLRFIDPHYGFITPKSADFTVIVEDNIVKFLRMYPQTEPLLLDDALKIVLDLQEQWRRGGWVRQGRNERPAFADTPEWRARLQDVNKGGTTYWFAGDKHQATLSIHRVKDKKRPEEERYRISLEVGEPWVLFR